MSDWKEYTVKSFAEILDTKRIPLSSTERAKRTGIYPYYGASGIIDYIDGYIFEGEYLLISEDGENLNSRQTPIAFRANGKFWVNNHAHVLKGKKSFHNRLLEFIFANLDLSPSITGAVQPKLSQKALLDITFELPESETEQEAIAEVLSSLDDKIDLLHRNNKTLEQLAETLFRQWFVEEDVEFIRLGDALKTTSGGTPSRAVPQYYTGNIPWIKSKELPNGFILDTEEKITDDALKNSSAKKLPPFTVLIAMYGATVGEIGISTQIATCNQAIAAIPATTEYPFTFLFNFFKSIKDDLINLAVGAAQQNISQILIQEILIPKSGDKINQYHKVVDPFYHKVLSNTQQIKKLETLRDTLLPKLMSGAVTVNNMAYDTHH